MQQFNLNKLQELEAAQQAMQAAQQPAASAAQQMPMPGVDNSAIQQLISQINDPAALKREKIGNLVSNLGAGLASVTGAFHKGKGAEISAGYQNQLQNQIAGQGERAATRQSQVNELVKLMQGDQTGGMKEYGFYAKQAMAAGQTPMPFAEWDLRRRQAGSGATPMDPRLLGILDKVYAQVANAFDTPAAQPAGPSLDVKQPDWSGWGLQYQD